MGQTKSNTAKKLIPFPLQRKTGADELNICEFPLYVPGRHYATSVKTLKFEDDIFDQGRGKHIHRTLTVSGSDAVGLPTPVDSDVLLVLMHLTNMRNGFSTPDVRFTRYELVNLLGWNHGGTSYRRLEESLNRWASVTLYYGQAWWDKRGRKWRSTTFHVIESVELRGRVGANEDSESTFVWNNVLFDSFKANHMKRLDLETYFALKSPAARQAYRFLDKRFYRSRTLTFDFRSFACEHIGLSRSYDNSQLKRKMRTALSELERIGFLAEQSDSKRYTKVTRGVWQITLIRQGQGKDQKADEVVDDQGGTMRELLRRGVHESIARKIVSEIPEEKIRTKLRVLDWLLEQEGPRRPKNPAGYLAASIRNDYSVPEDFHDKEKVVTGQKSAPKKPAAKSCKRARENDKGRVAFEKFWMGLSKKKQTELEKRAMCASDHLTASVCERLRPKGGKMWDEMRVSTIRHYAEKNGLIGT